MYRKGFTFVYVLLTNGTPFTYLGIPPAASLLTVNVLSFKYNYYSFKIFPQFWLAKSTRVIHHNQLLMTKSERILCLKRKWRQKDSLLQVNAPLTEKTRGRDWVVFVVKTKMEDTSLVSRVRTTAGTRRKNYSKNEWVSRNYRLEIGEIMAKNVKKKPQEDNSEGDICYLENICGAGQTLNVNYRR